MRREDINNFDKFKEYIDNHELLRPGAMSEEVTQLCGKIRDLAVDSGHGPTGIMVNVHCEDENGERKNIIGVLVGNALEGDNKIKACEGLGREVWKKDQLLPLFISVHFECWRAEVNENTPEDWKKLPPSERPDKEEAIVVTACPLDGVGYVCSGEITRNEKGVIEEVTWGKMNPRKLGQDKFMRAVMMGVLKEIKGVNENFGMSAVSFDNPDEAAEAIGDILEDYNKKRGKDKN